MRKRKFHLRGEEMLKIGLHRVGESRWNESHSERKRGIFLIGDWNHETQDTRRVSEGLLD